MKSFVDTNLLVYSVDGTEPDKQEQAHRWMARLWTERSGSLSYQVLQEFYATATGKTSIGVDPEEARSIVRGLLTWDPVPIGKGTLEQAWLVQDRWRFSWWDSLIVGAAWQAGCDFLLTEDLQDGLDLGGLRVVDPFRQGPESV